MSESYPLGLTQTTIADRAEYLTEAAGDNLYWASLAHGRASLKNVVPIAGATGIYELNHVGLLDPQTDSYTATRYIFDKRGIILGVINSQIERRRSNMQEVEEAMVFQVENGLYAPGEEDYARLAEVLQSGVMDAPIIRVDVDEK